ncbi:MAG: alginate export family protein [Methylococcaceae bacterium]
MNKKVTYLVFLTSTIFPSITFCADENVVISEAEHAYDRAEKAFYSKEWKELPDEHLINASKIKWNRLAKAALNLPEWMEFSLSQRTRFESSSHPWHTGQSSETNQQLPLLSRVRLGAYNENFGLIFEGQDGRTHFNNPGNFTGDANSLINQFDVLQLYTSATMHNIAGSGLRADLDVGRFTMDIGSSRLMGRNVYENITFSYEGGHFDIGAENKDWRLRTFFVSPLARYPNQADESSSNRLIWGVDLEGKPTTWLNSEVYYMGVNDNKNPNPNNHKAFSTFGTRAYQLPAKSATFQKADFGGFDYDFETTAEVGEKGVKDFFGYYGHAEIGYTFNAPWFPRLMADYDYSSGTENPDGSMNNTFDRLYGPRINMSVTSLFGPTFQTNMEFAGLRLIAKPTDDIKLNLKHHVWYLAEAKDRMVNTGFIFGQNDLQDKSGSAGRNLGHDIEFTSSYSLGTNLTFEAGYQHWFKGDYFERLPKLGDVSKDLPQGGEKDTDFFYVSSEVRF